MKKVNPCNNHSTPAIQLPNNTNDNNISTTNNTLPDYQQPVVDEADLESASDLYSFETANDENDEETDNDMNSDTEMITATSEHKQTIVDEAKVESNDGTDILDPIGTFV